MAMELLYQTLRYGAAYAIPVTLDRSYDGAKYAETYGRPTTSRQPRQTKSLRYIYAIRHSAEPCAHRYLVSAPVHAIVVVKGLVTHRRYNVRTAYCAGET